MIKVVGPEKKIKNEKTNIKRIIDDIILNKGIIRPSITACNFKVTEVTK